VGSWHSTDSCATSWQKHFLLVPPLNRLTICSWEGVTILALHVFLDQDFFFVLLTRLTPD
jgi:hypothetical protein